MTISLSFRRRHVAAAATFVGVVVLIFIGDWLIVTDGERIDATVRALRAAVERGDAQALMARVSHDFRNRGGLTREDLAGIAEDFFSLYGPVEFHRFRFDRNRAGDITVVAVSAIVSVDKGRAGTGSSAWELELKKEADGVWRVTDLAPMRLDGRDTDGWNALPEVRSLRSAPRQGRGRGLQEG